MSATATTPLRALAEAESALHSLGYLPGVPRHFGAHIADIDREACAESDCDRCGAHGCRYLPFHKGRTYRPLCVCPACGHCAEF